jgi:hypothetical protein
VYISIHALIRIQTRLPRQEASDLISVLERESGEPGVVLYHWPLPTFLTADDGSNGDTAVVIAANASIETMYLRRRPQGFDYAPGTKVVELAHPSQWKTPVSVAITCDKEGCPCSPR